MKKGNLKAYYCTNCKKIYFSRIDCLKYGCLYCYPSKSKIFGYNIHCINRISQEVEDIFIFNLLKAGFRRLGNPQILASVAACVVLWKTALSLWSYLR